AFYDTCHAFICSRRVLERPASSEASDALVKIAQRLFGERIVQGNTRDECFVDVYDAVNMLTHWMCCAQDQFNRPTAASMFRHPFVVDVSDTHAHRACVRVSDACAGH